MITEHILHNKYILLGIVDKAKGKGPADVAENGTGVAIAGKTWVDDEESDVCAGCRKIILPGRLGELNFEPFD